MAQAYMNWGRWVVDCECKSAERVDSFPAEVICQACGKTIQVEYPPNRQGIEAVLAHRPPTRAGSRLVHNHRSWRPGETVADLQRENQEHGVSDRVER